jgi:hypothetical protein
MAGMPEFGIGVVPPSGPFEPRPMPVIGFAVGLYRGFGVGYLIAKPVKSIGSVPGGEPRGRYLAPPIGVPT